MNNKFNIGDVVLVVTSGMREKTAVCSECAGKKKLKVIDGYGNEYMIDCGCGHGFDKPSGTMHYHEFSFDTEEKTITGLDVDREKTKYRFDCSSYLEKYVFALTDRAGAEAFGKTLVDEQNAYELKRMETKEKPTHDWAWNVRYHKRNIARLEKELEYNKSKLGIAISKVNIKTG